MGLHRAWHQPIRELIIHVLTCKGGGYELGMENYPDFLMNGTPDAQ